MDNIRSPEDARAALADWKTRADKLAADSVAASEAVQAITATGEDANRLVSVTLNSSGAVTKVSFSTAFQRLQPRHAERQFMEAYTDAGSKLMEAAKAAVAERLSDDSPTARALVDSIRMRFPDPPAEY